jgi:putative ABC transport system permease protein
MPDDAHEGVMWAPRAAVEQLTGLGGAFSAVSLAVARGASTPPVLAAVDRLLAPYGGTPSYARTDQVSHKFQQDRIDRLGVMATIIPPVFLVVAASLVNLVLGRMVETEREQIGLLKAFGYADLQAAAPYLKLAGLVGVAGVAVGGALGGWLAHAIVTLLAEYMRFPHLASGLSWTAFAAAASISIAAAIAGSLLAARRAARLSPVVAMQPTTPTRFSRGFVERLAIWRVLDQSTRMIVRQLERFPARGALTVGGFSVSLSLLIMSQFLFGSIDTIVDQSYYRSNRWTDSLAFGEARDIHALAELAHLPAVLRVEPIRTVPARMRAHARDERISITAFDEDSELVSPLDAEGRRVPILGPGVIVSTGLAAKLNIRPGEIVDVEITGERRSRGLLPVTGVADVPMGLTAYMSRDALNRFMSDGDLVSSANLLVDADRRGEFYQAVARLPQIVSAASRDDTVAAFRSAIAQVLTAEMTFFLGFAAAIAFGVAFNISRIALADRARDLATLRVLGFGRVECAYILAGELIGLAVLAAPIGIAAGFGLAHALVTAFTRQDFYLPFAITPRGIGISCTVYLAAVTVAAAFSVHRIWRFDLVAVLKTRE